MMQRKEIPYATQLKEAARKLKPDPLTLEHRRVAGEIISRLRQPVQDAEIQQRISGDVLKTLVQEFLKIKQRPILKVTRETEEPTGKITKLVCLSLGDNPIIISGRTLNLTLCFLLVPNPRSQLPDARFNLCHEEISKEEEKIYVLADAIGEHRRVFEQADLPTKRRLALKALNTIYEVRRQELSSSLRR